MQEIFSPVVQIVKHTKLCIASLSVFLTEYRGVLLYSNLFLSQRGAGVSMGAGVTRVKSAVPTVVSSLID